MSRFIRVLSLLLVALGSTLAFAGAGEEANAVVDRWSAAYTSMTPRQLQEYMRLTPFFLEP